MSFISRLSAARPIASLPDTNSTGTGVGEGVMIIGTADGDTSVGTDVSVAVAVTLTATAPDDVVFVVSPVLGSVGAIVSDGCTVLVDVLTNVKVKVIVGASVSA